MTGKPPRFVACVLLLAMTSGCAAPVPGGQDRPTLAVAEVVEAALIATYTGTPVGRASHASIPQGTSDPASLSLAEVVAAVSDYPYPPLDFGCQFTGQLIDWASAHGLAALDVELTNHRDTDFEQNLAVLSTLLNWQR